MTARFHDFDLRIHKVGDAYTAEVVDSQLGGASERFTFDKSEHEFENLLLKMGRTRSGTRSSATSEQRRAAEALGAYLFDTVITGRVREKLSLAISRAQADDTGLRVRLHLARDPDLLDKPWEFLYDTGRGQFLVLSGRTPVVRYPPVTSPTNAIPAEPPLRILVAISGAVPPGGWPLDVDHEWELLNGQALSEAVRLGLVAVDRVPGNMSDIAAALDADEYHVFHFIGHSGFQDGESVLWLEGSDGAASARPGNDLAQILDPHSSLRLAVFNSCEGARQSAQDPFAGVAQSLLSKGVPAVVAMQFEITDDAAIRFSSRFYSAIARGDAVDRAVSEARRAIFAADNDIEWGTPVLFLRSEDGRVFDMPELTPQAELDLQRHAAWYRSALDHIAGGRWAEAADDLGNIEAERGDYLSTRRLLREARSHVGPGARPEGRGLPDVDRTEPDQGEQAPEPPITSKWIGALSAVILLVLAAILVIWLFSMGDDGPGDTTPPTAVESLDAAPRVVGIAGAGNYLGTREAGRVEEADVVLSVALSDDVDTPEELSVEWQLMDGTGAGSSLGVLGTDRRIETVLTSNCSGPREYHIRVLVVDTDGNPGLGSATVTVTPATPGTFAECTDFTAPTLVLENPTLTIDPDILQRFELELVPGG